jgi:rhamnulokinase
LTTVLAVDLGATSARVARVDLDTFDVEVVHRYAHQPVGDRWDWDRLVAEVERGLALAGPAASIGVDTWGVDYGLLGADGVLLSPPHAYRSDRTRGWRAVVDRIGERRLYETTGIQLMQINTIFQLAAHDRDELARAHRLLMLPELLVHALTGEAHGERTSAGTSALVDLRTGTWSVDLLDTIGVEVAIMPTIEPAGTIGGSWRDVPVHLVGGHDTASAVAAMPVPGAAFVSSGTWMLVGVERPEPALDDVTFSNEPGVGGGVRRLKNVMGLWMLERCRAQWGDPPLDELLDAAASVAAGPVVDARDDRFLAPADMEAEVRAAAGLPSGAGRDVVVRCILDSLAAATAGVLGELGVAEVCVIGGGAQNALLNQRIAEASGLPVHTGPVEATALGNAMVQGISLGAFVDLDDARAQLRAAIRR